MLGEKYRKGGGKKLCFKIVPRNCRDGKYIESGSRGQEMTTKGHEEISGGDRKFFSVMVVT